jgi:hypothetical protein
MRASHAALAAALALSFALSTAASAFSVEQVGSAGPNAANIVDPDEQVEKFMGFNSTGTGSESGGEQSGFSFSVTPNNGATTLPLTPSYPIMPSPRR